MATLASAFGIRTLAPAIVFAVLYVPLLAFFFLRTVARPTYVYIILTFFCAVRVTAFSLRAALAHVPADANNVHLLIAYEIIYNIGFFGLLYSAYTLVAERVAMADNPPDDPLSRLLRKRFLFRLALMAAVAIGITGVVQSSTGSTASTIATGTTLRRVSVYIFLVCTVLVFLQTLLLARVEASEGGYRRSTGQFGATNGIYILVLVSVLLLVREIFFTATNKDPAKQNNEAFWYPLAVVTEFITVALFATPGLVPNSPKES